MRFHTFSGDAFACVGYIRAWITDTAFMPLPAGYNKTLLAVGAPGPSTAKAVGKGVNAAAPGAVKSNSKAAFLQFYYTDHD